MSDEHETDEGKLGEPMTVVEMIHAMVGVGASTFEMYKSFRESGFDEAQAMGLARAFVHGLGGGKLG